MYKKYILRIIYTLVIVIGICNSALADITCKGRVLQPEDFEPFIGATVILDKEGSIIGTATDLYGFFTLTVPENSILRFEFGGKYFQTFLTAKENMGDIILFERRDNGFKKVKAVTESIKNQWNEEGLTLIAKQQFKDAFRRFKAASDKGSARGMFLLAQCYRNEIGVKKDMKKYIKYMLSAADNDYDKAQYQVGMMYRDGDILDKNIDLAEAYLKKASSQNNSEAKKALDELRGGK